MEILTHLWYNYGNIGLNEITENEKRMKASQTPPNHIEDLFKEIREGQEFAKKGGEMIDNNTLVRYGYEVINSTGMFKIKGAK